MTGSYFTCIGCEYADTLDNLAKHAEYANEWGPTPHGPPPDARSGPYKCTCGQRGSMTEVMEHVHERYAAGDTRYYADGGHAIDLRD